ncbi:uncharacterized protein [Epargyreus clarus]|uniref:uncharacterized protein n=1 Tax=Epargyreus clarus TaxID=520877 RepID=UPI003C2FD806
MVQSCVVSGYDSTWCPNGDIKFHAFPQNDTRRKLWLSIVPLKMKFYKSARICNLHFQETDYDLKTRRLKSTAVPTILLNQQIISPVKTSSTLHEESMVPTAALAVPSTSSTIYKSNSPHKEMGVKSAGCNVEDHFSKIQCREVLGNISNLNKLTVSSSEDHVPAMICRGVQAKIKSNKEKILQRKTKILKQKVTRQTQKIQDMSSLIATIKKYTRQSEIENIIQGRFADICKEFKKPQRNPHGIRYSEEVKAFAYEFLRKHTSLPHVETIRRSLSRFNCNVGFLSEVLEYLKEQVKLPEKIHQSTS